MARLDCGTVQGLPSHDKRTEYCVGERYSMPMSGQRMERGAVLLLARRPAVRERAVRLEVDRSTATFANSVRLAEIGPRRSRGSVGTSRRPRP